MQCDIVFTFYFAYFICVDLWIKNRKSLPENFSIPKLLHPSNHDISSEDGVLRNVP